MGHDSFFAMYFTANDLKFIDYNGVILWYTIVLVNEPDCTISIWVKKAVSFLKNSRPVSGQCIPEQINAAQRARPFGVGVFDKKWLQEVCQDFRCGSKRGT
jgi:hypothetical protein